MKATKLMLMLIVLTLGMLVAVGAAKQPGGHQPGGGHDKDFGGHYDWLNPGGIYSYYSYPYYLTYPNNYYDNY